jgi:hypothetical protein
MKTEWMLRRCLEMKQWQLAHRASHRSAERDVRRRKGRRRRWYVTAEGQEEELDQRRMLDFPSQTQRSSRKIICERRVSSGWDVVLVELEPRSRGADGVKL